MDHLTGNIYILCILFLTVQTLVFLTGKRSYLAPILVLFRAEEGTHSTIALYKAPPIKCL